MPDQPEKPVSLVIQADPTQPLSKEKKPDLPPDHLVVEAEWVRRYPARRRRHWLYWLAALLKIAAACAITWLFLILPAGALPSPLQTWKNPVIIFLLVCFIGKTLLDTFFYDHFQF